jgi:hypothetical protein
LPHHQQQQRCDTEEYHVDLQEEKRFFCVLERRFYFLVSAQLCQLRRGVGMHGSNGTI